MIANVTHRLESGLKRAARAYLRYCPILLGKETFWRRVVEPRWAWQPHPFKVSTRFGLSMAGNTSELLQQSIYFFGVWEPHITNWIRTRLKPGDVFIDVGANIGYYTLLGAKLVGPTGGVVALEASGRTLEALDKNLSDNRITNVRTLNVAAWNKHTTLPFHCGPKDHVGLGSVVPSPNLTAERLVPAAPLDDVLHPSEINRTRLVKIDVEGAEWAVAEGMTNLIKVGRRDLEFLIEIHTDHLLKQGKNPNALLDTFGQSGFQPYRLENDYSVSSLLAPLIRPKPKLFTGPIDCEMNLVLSRSLL